MISDAQPPLGWFAFGTHVDRDIPLVFSTELDDSLMPLWERPAEREHEVPRSDVEYVVYRARDLLEWGQEHDAWNLLDQMTRRIGRSEIGPASSEQLPG